MDMQNSENTLAVLNPTLASENAAASSTPGSDAQRSRRSGATGPRTAQGKERSKRNAIKHGIFSQVALLKGESRAQFDALLNGLRDSLQPEGALEETLVEKIALLVWRQRRLIIAETAEIQSSMEFQSWNDVQRRAEGATKISEHEIRHQGGLIQRIADAEVLEGCLELLKELREGIEANGFDPKCDADILANLYGQPSGENWPRTLFDSYRNWLAAIGVPEDERLQRGFPKPDECKESFLAELDGEIKRVERYKKTHASIEVERRKLEVLRQHVPLTPQFDHLVRYETSLERNFDRTLSQLERLQRVRLHQPVLPTLEVHHSLS
jgi:hypothetical protein